MQKIMFQDKYGLTKKVLDGSKPLTRRGMKRQPTTMRHLNPKIFGIAHAYYMDGKNLCQLLDKNGMVIKPQYKVGEIVAVAQSYKDIVENNLPTQNADEFDALAIIDKEGAGWNNKMFVKADLMPHLIEITGVRVERLQDISDEDCIKEGIVYLEELGKYYFENTTRDEGFYFDTQREAFASLINKVSGKGTWKSNPFVWVYEFELVK